LKKIFLCLCILISIIFCEENLDYHLHLYSINRLSDGNVIKIPFRLADIDFSHKGDDLDVISRISFEYKPKYSDFYLESNSPEEFYIDLRELYARWYFNNSDFSVGKQIHTWGSVDQNSPLDNASPYDYYYIFSVGAEQKIGSFSGAYNYYSQNNTIGFVFSPIHHTNRLPLGNDDFPIELPVTPNPNLIKNVDSEVELGAYIKHSFDSGDITLSYYKGNDRVYNLSGVNVFTNEQSTVFANIDTVFTFRETDVIGLGATFIHDLMTIRFDYGMFHTKDPNSSVERLRPDMLNGTALDDLWYQVGATHAFEEEVYYDQLMLQLDKVGDNSRILLGLFDYNIKDYNAEYLAAVDIPGVEADVNPKDYFYPGLGAPIAILAERALMYQYQVNIGDNKNTELMIKGVHDLNDSGFLTEIGSIFSLSDDIKLHMYLNNIEGDTSQDDEYRFNQMKDFSHFRLELEYFF
tara:strand:- start:263 stop:1654 length:1392 start_codon:yes stop_codon:yes gene_type:complete